MHRLHPPQHLDMHMCLSRDEKQNSYIARTESEIVDTTNTLATLPRRGHQETSAKPRRVLFVSHLGLIMTPWGATDELVIVRIPECVAAFTTFVHSVATPGRLQMVNTVTYTHLGGNIHAKQHVQAVTLDLVPASPIEGSKLQVQFTHLRCPFPSTSRFKPRRASLTWLGSCE